MGWIAAKQIKTLREGVYVDLVPGDDCPEAQNWPNVAAWERTGFVKHVPDGTNPYRVRADTIPTVAVPAVQVKTDKKGNGKPTVAKKPTVSELRKLSKDQLVTMASSRGIPGTEALKRNAIIELILEG